MPIGAKASRAMLLIATAAAVATLLACGLALAAAGDLDPSFGGDGRVTTKFGELDNRYGAADLIVQPDGKLVAAGSTYTTRRPGSEEDDLQFALARYLR